MKNIRIGIAGLGLVVINAIPSITFAAVDPGIKPGSLFYFFDTAAENVVLFFTFNPESKAKKALEYADERLAEAEASTGANDNAALETALAGYKEKLTFASEKSKEVKDSAVAETLFGEIASTTSNNEKVLIAVFDRVPEEAKEAITRAIEASKNSQDEALRQVADLKKEVNELKEEIAELKKQKEAVPAIQTDVKSQSTIQELKKEVEALKKQSVVPVISDSQNSISKVEVSAEDQILILTNSIGVSYSFDNRVNNNQRIQDLIDVGFFVTKGKLPEGVSVKSTTIASAPTTTPVALKPLEIVLLNVSSTFNTMIIEWTTNKLTDSRAYLSANNSSMVYKSESGQSTRHVVHISNLSGNTTYEYEIEAVSGTDVAKNRGSFSTKQVKENAQLKITSEGGDSCNANINGRYCFLEVYYFENGERVNNDSITIFSDDDGIFTGSSYSNHVCSGGEISDSSGTRRGNPLTCFTRPSGNDGKPVAYFGYIPSATSTRTITATTNGVVATLRVEGQIK